LHAAQHRTYGNSHIIEQISMIEDILKKELAYVVNGSVYFDVRKYAKDHDTDAYQEERLMR